MCLGVVGGVVCEILTAVPCLFQNRSGHTALTAACRFGQLDAVEMLLNNGADVNLETSRGSYVVLWWRWYWTERVG